MTFCIILCVLSRILLSVVYIEVHTAFVRIKLMMMIYGDGDHGGMQVFEGAANVLHSAARVSRSAG